MDTYDHTSSKSSADTTMSSNPSSQSGQSPPPPRSQEAGQLEGASADQQPLNISFAKGTKRKRLAKACDACHKSKRRCDGTAPCGNCYFASKACTYTDASGRPVPAPHKVPSEPSSSSTAHAKQVAGMEFLVHSGPGSYQPGESSSPRTVLELGPEEPGSSRKRYRADPSYPQSGVSPSGEPIPRDPMLAPQPINTVFEGPSGMDPSLTRELVNLFFTHRHPQRMIIHKPTFSAALSHNRVPTFLIHAICAVAAPLSKQPRFKMDPTRFAGQSFADAAASLMFDPHGRLVAEPNLATAQALCLLQSHDYVTAKEGPASRYHDVAIQVLETMGVHTPDKPVITPLPSQELINTAMERECARRAYWMIHFYEMRRSIFWKLPLTWKENQLMLRMPTDETSFEFTAHNSLPEYLYLPAPRTKYASEFGHLIRVTSIHAKIEHFNDISPDPATWVAEYEQYLQSWADGLPEHLRFNEDNLQLQLSMLETSSNSGAWCFCVMHITHTNCLLALNAAEQRSQRAPVSSPPWAADRIKHIMTAVGGRSKYSLLSSSALLPLLRYYGAEDPQTQKWADDHWDIWGIRVEECVASGPERRQEGNQLQHHPSRALPEDSRPPFFIQQRDLSLGRSLYDLRLNSIGQSADPRGTAPTRSISDADIDPSLQGSGQRNEVPLSLPSLKSSGLLDSWSTPGDTHTNATASQTPKNVQPNGKAENQSAERRKSPHSESSRPVPPSNMPVGMAWLADESNTPR